MHVITQYFLIKIDFDRQLYLLFRIHVWELDRQTKVNKRHITIEFVYLYS